MRYFVNSFIAGFLLLISLVVLPLHSSLGGEWKKSRKSPPALPREFRAAWIATVYNLDWPSKPGLSADRQKAELRKILDGAVSTGLNAVIFQVRPAADALYDSPYETWSIYLSGASGRSPGYDPLAFACAEAHRRGLELHAWFNPFRGLTNAKNKVPRQHLVKRHPEWVVRHGAYLWLDPGIPAVRDYTIKVIIDVVRRYDIDGVHIDDYFYPYPQKGVKASFPDGKSWRKFGGRGNRDDWRRNNINGFVKQLNTAIKREKPWVKFGISPFGIWKPGVPTGTTAGLNAHGQLYADSRKWLRSGWLDYFSPQLYWKIASDGQSFPLLLKWWHSENKKQRHVWPGIATDRVGKKRKASEIVEQIRVTRRFADRGSGHIHWNMAALLKNSGGVKHLVKQTLYREQALVPASPWMGRQKMPAPSLQVATAGKRLAITLESVPGARFWVLQTRRGSNWQSQLIDARNTRFKIDRADVVAVSALGRFGDLSPAAVLKN